MEEYKTTPLPENNVSGVKLFISFKKNILLKSYFPEEQRSNFK